MCSRMKSDPSSSPCSGSFTFNGFFLIANLSKYDWRCSTFIDLQANWDNLEICLAHFRCQRLACIQDRKGKVSVDEFLLASTWLTSLRCRWLGRCLTFLMNRSSQKSAMLKGCFPRQSHLPNLYLFEHLYYPTAGSYHRIVLLLTVKQLPLRLIRVRHPLSYQPNL